MLGVSVLVDCWVVVQIYARVILPNDVNVSNITKKKLVYAFTFYSVNFVALRGINQKRIRVTIQLKELKDRIIEDEVLLGPGHCNVQNVDFLLQVIL
jgi:hypothetical protein